MKYESDILKRLIDTYGVVGNPQYMSEIIKEFIVQGKECFPNLFTYQSDWLAHIDEFGLKPSYTVSYTGQSIYAPNTLEKPVKSAILKGQTLVNLTSNDKIYYQKAPTDNWNDYPIAINPQRCSINIKNIKPNTTYLIKTLSETKEFYIRFFNETTTTSNGNTGWISINSTFTTLSDTNKISISFRLSKKNEDYTDVSQCSNILLLEYQDGMENWDIDYFEGMQSVKMPVLTTTGKNLWDGNYEVGDISTSTGNNIVWNDAMRSDFIEISPLQNYVCSSNMVLRNTNIFFYDSNKKFIKHFFGSQFTSPLNAKYIRWSGGFTDRDLFQIEEGTQATTYEPYKSNILSVNEDVTLRGIGDVKDELDLLTGKLTQRIDEDGEVLAKEVIKTVDLTIHDKDHQKVERLTSFEGGTHFTTSSQDGSLLPTLTVDVVTDLEETLRVCSLEGNTM